MMRKSGVALIAMLMGVAAPALAQSPSERYGSQLPYYYEGSGGQVKGAWAPTAAQPGAAQPAGRPLYMSVKGAAAVASHPKTRR
jgi:hypothetical protein